MAVYVAPSLLPIDRQKCSKNQNFENPALTAFGTPNRTVNQHTGDLARNLLGLKPPKTTFIDEIDEVSFTDFLGIFGGF